MPRGVQQSRIEDSLRYPLEPEAHAIQQALIAIYELLDERLPCRIRREPRRYVDHQAEATGRRMSSMLSAKCA
jgi:hypothetical protein